MQRRMRNTMSLSKRRRGIQRFRSPYDGEEWSLDFDREVVTGRMLHRGISESCTARFTGLPAGGAAMEFLWLCGPALKSSMVGRFATQLSRYLNFAHEKRRAAGSAECFGAYVDFLNDGSRKESTRRGMLSATLVFLDWAQQMGMISATTHQSMRSRMRRHFRGFKKRQYEIMMARAIAPEEYTRLLRAIRMELEEQRGLIERGDAIPSADACLPAILVLGALLAMRPAEFNAMCAGDLRTRESEPWLYLHAPNKAHAYVWLSRTCVEALKVALTYEATRGFPRGDDDPFFRKPNGARLTSLAMSAMLGRFCEKYFRATDPLTGLPVLFRETAAEKAPLGLLLSDLRHAAISHMARTVERPQELKIFARHASAKTTMEFYVKTAQVELIDEVSLALKPFSEALRMALRNEIATPADAAAASKAGALLPGGHCQEVLRGIVGCLRATDCRRCKHFRIHPDKRAFFVQERQRSLGIAVAADSIGCKRDSEVARGQAALNDAIIDRIDEHLLKAGAAL
jgi:hypothetical protein